MFLAAFFHTTLESTKNGRPCTKFTQTIIRKIKTSLGTYIATIGPKQANRKPKQTYTRQNDFYGKATATVKRLEKTHAAMCKTVKAKKIDFYRLALRFLQHI